MTGSECLADLREHSSAVPDPRARRGVRHALVSILSIAAAAVASGARSFTAIGEWAAAAPQRVWVLGGTGPVCIALLGEATVRRVLQTVDPDAVNAAIGTWLTGRTATPTTPVTAVAVDGKTSEIAWFAPLLDRVALNAMVVTADALHTVLDHAPIHTAVDTRSRPP